MKEEKMTGYLMVKKIPVILLTIIFLISSLLLAVSCRAEDKDTEIILATTTTTYGSGLLDALLPAFEEQYGYNVKPFVVGTGEAIAMGERGEVDIIMVHSRAWEDKFVEDGFGTERFDVMHNDFVVIGPEADPAGISGLDAAGAYAKIAWSGSLFVSRGDDSGTHKKELSIWDKAEAAPGGEWYLETGQGMGETLRIADEKKLIP